MTQTVDRIRTCTVEGCVRPFAAKGLCKVHHRHLRRHGDPLPRPRRTPRRDAIDAILRSDTQACIYWKLGKYANGYGSASYPRIKSKRAHRIMLILSTGVLEDRVDQLYACHTCNNGNLGCVNPIHLYWGTPQDNVEDQIEAGTFPKKESHHSAILTEEQVKEIRNVPTSEVSYALLSRRFGVTKHAISDVRTGRSWKDV